MEIIRRVKPVWHRRVRELSAKSHIKCKQDLNRNTHPLSVKLVCTKIALVGLCRSSAPRTSPPPESE